MGKKSRKKRERRIAKKLESMYDIDAEKENQFYSNWLMPVNEDEFSISREKTAALLDKYNPIDAATALLISELWPRNAGSPIKHIFAWRMLLGLPNDRKDGICIKSYEEFKYFIGSLYELWPEFPSLEDFQPEADWGEIKARLGGDFVSIFYGSCLERTPDFIESFRITYADSPEALSHMDLAVALHRTVIGTISLQTGNAFSTTAGYVEIPPEHFWEECSSSLRSISTQLSAWRDKARSPLETSFGLVRPISSGNEFSEEVMVGAALPYIALQKNDAWIPISVRSAPAVVIDHWSQKAKGAVSRKAHIALSKYIAERFENVPIGPFTPYIGDTCFQNLIVSCVLNSPSRIYLICAVDHKSIDTTYEIAKEFYKEVSPDKPLYFRPARGPGFTLSKDGISGPAPDEICILIVPTQASTAPKAVSLPPKPSRLISLADLITIFDSLENITELDRFWSFVDTQRNMLNPFSTGSADLFAAFKDSHELLVGGATSPSVISLDPHWGTAWRFKKLYGFWELAPKTFPDDTLGWRLSAHFKGVVELQSRHHKAMSYSTSVGHCTVQTLVELSEMPSIEDARMVDLFAQLIADTTYRCQEIIKEISIYQCSHLVFSCSPASGVPVDEFEAPKSLENYGEVVTSLEQDQDYGNKYHLKLDLRAVQAGLNEAKDGSFEIRCLIEVIAKLSAHLDIEIPIDLEQKLSCKATVQARFYLEVVDRNVDVPDYIDPIIPTAVDYKRARKQLAEEIKALGFYPGQYELAEAKTRVDAASARLRKHIEIRLDTFDRQKRLTFFIEQHDAALAYERVKIQRARQSLNHDVEYDRLEAIEEARDQYGTAAKHYRYLLEKTVSSSVTGDKELTKDDVRELIGLVDWFMVLSGVSDVLHNGIDVGGIVIDEEFIPEVYYTEFSKDKQREYTKQYAKQKLGIGVTKNDAVEGELKDFLNSDALFSAFNKDLGFSLSSLLTSLGVLSQAQRHGFSDELSLSYTADFEQIAQTLTTDIDQLDLIEARNIVNFLTLSENGVLRLAGSERDEGDVPYWEHNKRIYRYAIRPLVITDTGLRWGAEATSRAMFIWMSAIRDGYLPADFKWPNIVPAVQKIKQLIEKNLEIRSEEIFLRNTPYALRGIDFFRRFRKEGFEDVGDFDVLAYWPKDNLIVAVECKYNQPPHTMKDGRRLRDKIFGTSEQDRAGQFSRIERRRRFIEDHREALIALLKWPGAEKTQKRYAELYVCRDVYYWMVHPPYPIPTQFVRVDTLDTFIKTELIAPSADV